MQNLEAQLHHLLEDIAQDVHTTEDSAKIIAVASSLITKRYNSRKMTKISSRQLEAHMTDALLQAMGTLDAWNYENDEDYFDGRGLSNNQLIQRVAKSIKPDRWKNMDILNPEDLDINEDPEISSKVEIENAQQTSEVYNTPGRGRHRSDFSKKTST